MNETPDTAKTERWQHLQSAMKRTHDALLRAYLSDEPVTISISVIDGLVTYGGRRD